MDTVAYPPETAVGVRRLLNLAVEPARPSTDFRHSLYQRLVTDAAHVYARRRGPRLRLMGRTLVLNRQRQAGLGLTLSLVLAVLALIGYLWWRDP